MERAADNAEREEECEHGIADHNKSPNYKLPTHTNCQLPLFPIIKNNN